jgi:hypothetical protein
MDISEIRDKCTDASIAVTQHLALRMRERGILYDEVITAIRTGEIIEDYPDAYPFPACLILCIETHPLHVVCGMGDDRLFIITAYRPDAKEWTSDWTKRKAARE